MAKRKKRVLPARRHALDDDSPLVRSAESLGRVIGSLQRQVRGAARRASFMVDDAMSTPRDLPRLESPFGAAAKKSARTRKAAGARKATRARTRSTARKASKKR